jgi:hypothetical protein
VITVSKTSLKPLNIANFSIEKLNFVSQTGAAERLFNLLFGVGVSNHISGLKAGLYVDDFIELPVTALGKAARMS